MIDRKRPSANRAAPHLVIALCGPLEEAARLSQQPSNIRAVVVDHQAASKNRCLVATISIGNEGDRSATLRFSAKSSGTKLTSLARSSSSVSASVTRPGISSLVATQTEASSSQAASTLRGGTGSSLHRRATYATLGPGVKTL